MRNDEEARFASPAEKAAELENSARFDFALWSEDPAVDAATDTVFRALRGLLPASINVRIHRNQLKLLLANLCEAIWHGDQYVALGRSKSFYAIPKRYKPNVASGVIIDLLDAMIERDLIEQEIGFNDRATGRSRLTRVRATASLRRVLWLLNGVRPGAISAATGTECIILRDRDSGDERQSEIEYEENAETGRMRGHLHRYNELLSNARLELQPMPALGAYASNSKLVSINLADRFVRRIFNRGSWQHGGRFYGGWWQRLPKKLRYNIEIDGTPATELDYTGLHIALLYAMEGLDFSQVMATDPYQLDGFEQSSQMREFLKLVLLVALNARTLQSAEAGIQREINFDPDSWGWVGSHGVNLGTIIDAFAKRHAPIRKYLFSGEGLKLQYVDSCMAEKVISSLMAEEIPVLCVHDSFIVATDKLPRLKEAMKDAFLATTTELSRGKAPFLPRITESGIGQSTWEAYEWFREKFELRDYSEMLKLTGQDPGEGEP